MSKLVLSEDLEVQNFAEIPDRQLVKDIRVIDTYFVPLYYMTFIACEADVPPEDATKWMQDTPFPEILETAGAFDPRNIPGPNPPNEEQIASMQNRIDDFCAIVVMEQENASQILLDALSRPDISFGNVRSQWKQELRNRAAIGSLLG